MVAQAIPNNKWVRDILGAPSNRAIAEYLVFWEYMQEVEPQHDVKDSVMWEMNRMGTSRYQQLIACSLWQKRDQTWASLSGRQEGHPDWANEAGLINRGLTFVIQQMKVAVICLYHASSLIEFVQC
uniref:Uncharacterized protein n=1 Tax=Leersia perrieri TaxID=77586 RepID=A0A0D9W885_9ORYZ